MGKKILLITYHFYPDTAVGAKRPSELAKTLSKSGYDVDVITARRQRTAVDIDMRSIRVIGVPQPPQIVNNIVSGYKKIRKAIFRQKSEKNLSSENRGIQDTANDDESFYRRLRRRYFSCVALCDALKAWSLLVVCVMFYRCLGSKYLLVITSGPPMVMHNVGWLARKIFKQPWVMDLRDPFPVLDFIYPEKDFMSPDVKSRFRENIELWLEKGCLEQADGIVTASPGIHNEILSRYPGIAGKITTIYNGYDHPAPTYGSSVKLRGEKVLFLYAGMLYFNRNPFPFLKAIKTIIDGKLLPELEIEVAFYGDCEYWNGENLREWIKHHDMETYVKLYPPVSREAIRDIMQKADILMNFCQGQPLQIPAKTFDYIGTGKKSLVITEKDSASAALILESGSGIVIDPNQGNIEETIVQFCRSLLEADANIPDVAKYSRERQNAHYLEFIEQFL